MRGNSIDVKSLKIFSVSYLRLLLWSQQRVQRENVERNRGVSLLLYRDKTQSRINKGTHLKHIQLDVKNYSFGVACLHWRDRLRFPGQSLHPPHLRSPPPCPRPLRPLEGRSSYPDRFGAETGDRDYSLKIFCAQEISGEDGGGFNHIAKTHTRTGSFKL